MNLWLWLSTALLLAGDSPVDAGLSTQIQGSVARQSDGGSAAVLPFSKLRVGDTLVLGAGASVQVVYFSSGRRETWTGPAELVVGEAASEARSGAAPQVQETDAAVGEQLQTLPVLIARAERDRAGQGVVRSGAPAADPRTLLDDEELAAVAAAKTRYEALRKVFDPRDVLPDVYYATVLRSYGLQVEADQVLIEARGRCELCDLPALSSRGE